MATRNGRAHWQGDLKQGNGDFTVGEDAFSGAFSFSSRFEDGQGTNPEELLAAAHASCFSMALSLVLSEHGHPPEDIRSTARVTMRNVEGAPTITKIDLDTEGRVPGIDEDHFRAHAEQAKAGCVVSRALAGVDDIALTARLAT